MLDTRCYKYGFERFFLFYTNNSIAMKVFRFFFLLYNVYNIYVYCIGIVYIFFLILMALFEVGNFFLSIQLGQRKVSRQRTDRMRTVDIKAFHYSSLYPIIIYTYTLCTHRYILYIYLYMCVCI